MIDPVSLAVGGGLLALGWLAGRIKGSTPRKHDQEEAACGCGHPLALHDRDTATCHGQTRREHYLDIGSRNGWEWAPCTCRQYTGPQPIEELFSRPLLPPTGLDPSETDAGGAAAAQHAVG